MSSLRSSRALSNLQVETIRFSNTAIPEGATGSVFALDDDGFMSLTSDVVASTLTVGGTVSIGGVLQVGSLAVQQLLDVSSAVIANLRVTNSVTLPGSIVIPTGSTSVEALYIFAGVTNVPIDGDYLKYALDVSGASIMRGKMTTLGPISARSVFVEGATADVVFRPGSTAAADGRIQGTGSQLLIGSDSTIALGSLAGTTVAMTVQPIARLVSITAGTTLNVRAIGGVGLTMAAPTTFTGAATFAAASTFNATPTFVAPSSFTGPATFSGTTLTILSSAVLDVQSSIKNSTGPVVIDDTLSVYGTLQMFNGATISAQSQPLVLTTTGGFGVTVAGNLQVTGGLTVAGDLGMGGTVSCAYLSTLAGISSNGYIQATNGVNGASLNQFGGINATGELQVHPAGSFANPLRPTLSLLTPNIGSVSYINALGGNLGVGTTTPAYTLDVSGMLQVRAPIDAFIPGISTSGSIQTSSVNGVVSVNPFGGINMTGNLSIRQLGSGISGPTVQHLSPASDSYVNALGGRNFGVGTATPAYTLDVAGSARIAGNLYNTYFNAVTPNPVPLTEPPSGRLESSQMYAYDYIGYAASWSGGWRARSSGPGATNQGIAMWQDAETGNNPSIIGVNGTTVSCPLVFDTINKRVGIFNTTPAYELDVFGNINTSGTLRANGLNITGNGEMISLGVNTTANPAQYQLGVIGSAYVSSNIGIGTTTYSSYALNVNGSAIVSHGLTVVGNLQTTETVEADGLIINGNAEMISLGVNTTANPAQYQLGVIGSAYVSSNIGIGTTNYSSYALNVVGNATIQGTLENTYFNAKAANPNPLTTPPTGRLESSQMYAYDYVGYAASYNGSGWQARADNPNNSQGIAMWQTGSKPCIIGVNGTTVSYPLVFDTVNQRVGVFNATPQSALDISGSVRISQGLTVTGNLSLPVNTTATWSITRSIPEGSETFFASGAYISFGNMIIQSVNIQNQETVNGLCSGDIVTWPVPMTTVTSVILTLQYNQNNLYLTAVDNITNTGFEFVSNQANLYCSCVAIGIP